MQRGDLLLVAVEVLGAIAMTTAELIDALAIESSSYHHPWRWVYGGKHEVKRLGVAVDRVVEELHADIRGQQRVRWLIARLTHDGFISQNPRTKKWRLTVRGIVHRKRLRRRYQFSLPRYTGAPSDRTIIVAFDVPEREHKKRDWLRSALEVMGLKPLQKSVWAGRIKLPAEFFEDIEALGLTSCVQVLGVTASGTLQKVRQ